MARIDFHLDDDSPRIHTRRPAVPPVDTSSRGAWRKLFSLVLCFLLVLILMVEARKPKNWLWMGFDRDGRLPVAADQRAEAFDPTPRISSRFSNSSDEISIRLPGSAQTVNEPTSAISEITQPPSEQPANQQPEQAASRGTQQDRDVAASQPVQTAAAPPQQDGPITTDPVTSDAEPGQQPPSRPAANSLRAAQQFWATVFSELSNQQKRQLASLIYDLRKGKAYDRATADSLRAMLRQLDESTQKHALALLQSLQATDIQGAASLAANLRDWNESLLPYLRGAIDKDLTTMDVDQAALRLWESHIEGAALDLVRDLSEVHRPEEGAAWIVNWIRLLDNPTGPFRSVTVPELRQQPAAFRGQLVALKGTCIGIERLNLINPYLGTDTYYILWITPADPEKSVFCVYTLKLPEGLEEPKETYAKADFDVQIKGIFHKIRSYVGSEGQIETCPMLLAEQATIIYRPVVEDNLKMPSWFLPLMGVILFAAAIFALVSVYRSTQHKTYPPPKGYSRLRLEDDFKELQNDSSIRTPKERLAEFEQQHKQQN